MHKKSKRTPDYKYMLDAKKRIYKINRHVLGSALDFPIELINWLLDTTIDIKVSDSVKDELSTFHDISVDFFVCLIDALQLLFNGSTANTLSILRISLEALGLLHYSIIFNKFPEIRKRYILGLKTKNLQIDKAQEAWVAIKNYEKEKLGIKESAGIRIWGDLSNLVSHASAHRFNNNWISLDGEVLTTLGYRIYVEDKLPNKTISLINQLCAYYVNMTTSFYGKHGLNQAEELLALKNRFPSKFE